jgi:hypothetical protein
VAGVERSEPPESHTWGLTTRSSWLDPSHPQESVEKQNYRDRSSIQFLLWRQAIDPSENAERRRLRLAVKQI